MRHATLMSMLLMLPLATASIAAADLSGKWTIDGDVAGNPVNLTCAVKQDADAKITGNCQVNGMEATEIGAPRRMRPSSSRSPCRVTR
jgi:hypothetical protein